MDRKNSVPTVLELLVFPGDAELPSVEHLSLSASVSSVRTPPNASPTRDAHKGQISDTCQQNIIDLFATRFIRSFRRLRNSDPFLRYIITFDKNRLALYDAYTPEATFSCRFISSSSETLPYHFTKCNTGILQGPSNIVKALASFSQRIAFIPDAKFVLDATIDVLQLPDMNYFATLAFNTIIEGVDVSVDMAFLLKESARITIKRSDSRSLWTPFVMMSHQIILRS